MSAPDTFTCPNCRYELNVSHGPISLPVNCQNCGVKVFLIPAFKEDSAEKSKDIRAAFFGLLTVAGFLGALGAAMLMGGWNLWTTLVIIGGMIYLAGKIFLNKYSLSKKIEYIKEEGREDHIYVFPQDDKFNQIVNQALSELPKRIKDKLKEINIVVQDAPDDIAVKQFGPESNKTLAGLYQGIPLTQRSVWHITRLPDRITIFKKNIERYCASDKSIKKEVKRVVSHELGHFLGLNEEELQEMRRKGYKV